MMFNVQCFSCESTPFEAQGTPSEPLDRQAAERLWWPGHLRLSCHGRFTAAQPAQSKEVHPTAAPRCFFCGLFVGHVRYLADPLLIGGYKFHFRIHLVITNLSPLEAFVQENGQCLFATKPYKLSKKTLGANFDPPVHVTNMGLNATAENKENFLKEKPVIGKGQQIRVRQLMAHLQGCPKFNQVGVDSGRKELEAK